LQAISSIIEFQSASSLLAILFFKSSWFMFHALMFRQLYKYKLNPNEGQAASCEKET
jgi:hypothetical protein